MKWGEGGTLSDTTQDNKIAHLIYLINPRTGNNRKI